jgi:hypothetical protein
MKYSTEARLQRLEALDENSDLRGEIGYQPTHGTNVERGN